MSKRESREASRKYARDYYYKNRDKVRQYQNEYWKTHKRPDQSEDHRKRRYGLSQDELDAMYEAQSGRCLICGNDFGLKFHIDHSHKTGQIRGLLCRSCNMMLGMAEDVPEVLEEAARYLRKFE